MNDNEIQNLERTQFNLLDVLNAPDADRGYSVKELVVLTGVSEMTIRKSIDRTPGIMFVTRKIKRNWTKIYALDTKENRKFFGVEE